MGNLIFLFLFFAVPGEKKKKRQHICHIIGCGKVKILIALHSYYQVKTRRNYSYVKMELLHVCKKKLLNRHLGCLLEKNTLIEQNITTSSQLCQLFCGCHHHYYYYLKAKILFNFMLLLYVAAAHHMNMSFTSMYVATVVPLFQVTFLRVTIISITIISIINLLTFWPAFSIHNTPTIITIHLGCQNAHKHVLFDMNLSFLSWFALFQKVYFKVYVL